jgi:hypothetical protein
MNTSLTLHTIDTTRQAEAPARKPAHTGFLALLEGVFADAFTIIFATRDDPAALHYLKNKYNGEID